MNMKRYSVNILRSEGSHLRAYGFLYKTLGQAKRQAREKAKDLNVKRSTVFDLQENRTIYDALAALYNVPSAYNQTIEKANPNHA